MKNQLTDEQKKLTDLMIEDIVKEVKVEQENLDTMSKEPQVFTPTPNALTDGILQWGGELDFSTLKENSVLLIKINTDDQQYAHHFQMGVVRHVLEPRYETLKEKKVTVLFMSNSDDLSILSQEDMNKSGWFKKDQSRIIVPG